jgi:microcompartment protein CcmL/EutN
MQALGLIETRGLIAAVESADAMLKAAEVTLLEKTYVGGGLVSVAVTGGVAAVKAAVEAGAAAVKQISEALLVSQHVIPRPSEDLEDLIGPAKQVLSLEIQNAGPSGDESGEKTEEPAVNEAVSEEKTEQTIDVEAADEQAVEEPAVEVFTEDKEEFPLDGNLSTITKEIADQFAQQYGPEKILEVLGRLKVVKLRNLAREYGNMRIAGRAISKADKKVLLAEFEEYYRTH